MIATEEHVSARTVKKLDASQKQSVSYCIPLWLRDFQIDATTKRGLPFLTKHDTPRTEPIAIVGYGPSLNDTWERVRDFPYVMSCSGAHPFLIERGIIPTYHAAVDPQKGNTVRLIGTPHPDVEYLISATCHGDVFDLLAGHKVKVWYVFDSDAEAIRLLPQGAWAVTGGCDVGLRCLTLSALLGFRDLHVFGLDGSYGADGRRHAGAHPVPLPNAAITEFGGVTYKTTSGMLEAARQTCHEIDALGPTVRTTFYGDGLTQAMVRARTPKPQPTPMIAVAKPELITAAYIEQNRQLHERNPAYGVGGGRHAPTVIKLAESIKTKNILDYGCGKGRLGREIPWQIAEYDPAVPGKEASPKPADLVVCLDVLEHIEPEKLEFVLDDLRRVTRQVGYFIIYTEPSTKSLPDGRNAHLIQEDEPWWREVLGRYFTIAMLKRTGQTLHVVVAPRSKGKGA